MAKFDPWPVFFKREFNRNWPFLVGFSITFALVTKFTLGLTEEDAKNSPYAQRRKMLRPRPILILCMALSFFSSMFVLLFVIVIKS